ncbi:glucose 1-dehydrogenase [soil metagenome]
MGRVDGKVALVTGGARGQGREMAALLASEGATVIAGDVLEAQDTDGSPVTFVHLDVTSEQSWKEVVAQIIADHGRIDVLVNNAAIVSYEPILETSVELWDKILDVDLKGIFLGMREVIPHMIEQKGGSIVNVSSIWGLAASEGAHAYHAAKGGILNMTKNVAAKYGRDGIRANTMHPGYIPTPMNENQGDALTKELIDGTVLGRPGTSRETAYGVLYLASDEASYVTGTSLVIDGGYLVR